MKLTILEFYQLFINGRHLFLFMFDTLEQITFKELKATPSCQFVYLGETWIKQNNTVSKI